MQEVTRVDFTAGKILPVDIEDEMKRSYIDYAMSVIVSRALPDVRDGLKPVQRRILYSMWELGMTPDKPYKKSARVVGEVLGKYHPHGDAPVYEAMVRLAQDFACRYPLVDGHGNFGSIDGDAPAAMRYTEVRMSPLATELMADLDKETVDWTPNFDETLKEPVVLPSRFPSLMVNGAGGIAVGYATNIPPHNLGEVIDALVMMIDKPDVTPGELMFAIKGPDFPTGALIVGREGIKEAYTTGRGIVTMRAVARIEGTNGGKARIIVTEIPYQVNKANLIQHIANLVRDKKIEGISDLRDESDKNGLRIVIELKREANGNVLLNQLYKHTAMQQSFGIIMLALVKGKPLVLNLRDVLFHYLEHQKEVIIRRTRFELRKAEERAHILEGLRIALANLDKIIKLIRSSRTVDEARNGLMTTFGLSEKQAQAILDMRLQKLTALEREKIEEEYQELVKTMEYLRAVLASEQMVYSIIRREILGIKDKFADERRTRIVDEVKDFEVEDLIPEEDVVITLTHNGYIKRMPASTYKAQRRGGRGITGASTREEDFVEHLFITSTHHHMLFLTNNGKAYKLRVHEIPEASRQAKGLAAVNLIQVERDEKITAVIPVKEFSPGQHLLFATRNGTVKKIDIGEFANVRRGGIRALELDEGDELVGVHLVAQGEEVILATESGQAIRFVEGDVRPMGRTARGVIGVRLGKGDRVVGMDVVRRGMDVLTVTTRGFGKRTPEDQYPVHSRGGKGVRNIRLTGRTGRVAGIKVVREGDEVMLISAEGIIIRMPVREVKLMQRATQGVTLMRLEPGGAVTGLAIAAAKEED
ncbi:MAG: DNA gyrase subunit A [Firmicutes bacterium]|nr:DNA gyrase subunit A [Bacillota bacterium]